MRTLWIIIIVVLIALGAFILRDKFDNSITITTNQQRQGAFAPIDVTNAETVQVRPAASIIEQVSAAGNIALISQQYVALEVSGQVQQIAVNPGDRVQAG